MERGKDSAMLRTEFDVFIAPLSSRLWIYAKESGNTDMTNISKGILFSRHSKADVHINSDCETCMRPTQAQDTQNPSISKRK